MTETTVRNRVTDAALESLLRGFCGAEARYDLEAAARALVAFPRPRNAQTRVSASWHGRHAVRVGEGLTEGRTFRLTAGPGLLALSTSDVPRAERAAERVEDRRRGLVDLDSRRWLDVGLTPNGNGPPARSVVEWSTRSRSRMLRGFASVDWTDLAGPGLVLAMVTLTYPGKWETCAPTGAAAKRHLANLRRRYREATGVRWDGAWKLEFQRRGAPHFHLLLPVPALVDGEPFERWLSRTWADVVGADDDLCHGCGLRRSCSVDGRRSCRHRGRVHRAIADPRCVCEVPDTERRRHEAAGTGVDFSKTGRFTDPRRCAVYFVKHGTKTLDDKEYQHTVPALWQMPGRGPGRFWGFWGMEDRTAGVDLDIVDWLAVRRVARRAVRARRRAGNYRRRRAAALACGLSSAEATRAGMTAGAPAARSFGAGGSLGGGWLLVNDGAATAAALSRWVRDVPETRPAQRRRWRAVFG